MESLIFNQKKYQGIVIKTMAAIAAGVGLMMVCSSSVAAAMMMGGEEKETPATGAGAGAGPSAPVKKEYIVADESTISEYKGGYVEIGAGTSV